MELVMNLPESIFFFIPLLFTVYVLYLNSRLVKVYGNRLAACEREIDIVNAACDNLLRDLDGSVDHDGNAYQVDVPLDGAINASAVDPIFSIAVLSAVHQLVTLEE